MTDTQRFLGSDSGPSSVDSVFIKEEFILDRPGLSDDPQKETRTIRKVMNMEYSPVDLEEAHSDLPMKKARWQCHMYGLKFSQWSPHSTSRKAGTLLLQIQKMPSANNSMGMEEVPVSQVSQQPSLTTIAL